MCWRIGAWIAFILFVLVSGYSVLAFSVPEMRSSPHINWVMVPKSIATPLWYYESLLFLPLGALALLPAPFALFRQAAGKSFGWPLWLSFIFGAAVGFSLIVCSYAIVAYGHIPIGPNRWLLFTGSEVVFAIIYTLFLVFPFLYAILLSHIRRIIRTPNTG